MSKYQTENRSFDLLSRIGTRLNSSNHKNRMNLNASEFDTVGVAIEQAGEKKAMKMEVIIPLSRSRRDSRRTAKIELNGIQARRLYETLSRFYRERNEQE